MATQRTSSSTLSTFVAVLGLAAVTMGAASGGGDGKLKNLGDGVTADKIKVGIAIIDYDAIADFVDFARGDQEATAQIFVDHINDNGGVGGRMIEPYFKKYPPIPGRTPDPLSLCTAWTEDDDVFAVLGVFIDFTGQGQLCLTKEHNTIHIGHELEQPWIDQSPPGLLVTPDRTKEGAAATLLSLLLREGKLKGKTVGILADQNSEGRVETSVLPALKKAKVKTGSTAVLNIAGTDTSAAQAQLDSFIEKWKTEGVNAVYMAGLTVSAKQFVAKIRDALPKAVLLTDSDSTLEQAQDEAAAGTDPNPYEGMIASTGITASERWKNKTPQLQQCVDIYEDATGTTVPGPDEQEVNSSGKKVQLDVAVTDFCGELFMFRDIAEKVGPNLTVKNWQKTVDKLGPIELVPTTIASLCKGKYAADDASKLVEYDSSLGTNGDWAELTPISDASNGKCAAKS
jgi:ABC-type branched-subunit amino acid transport system substrate-binding protein